MDILSLFLFCFMSCAIGAILMLIVQYYAFIRYLEVPEEPVEQKLFNEQYMLPKTMMASIKSPEPESKNSIVAINLVLQFLFYELRYSNKVRKWFYRKLSLELDELITKTTTGRLFDKLTIRDLDLGAQFPEIKNVRVHNVDLHNTEGYIENVDLLLDLHYRGKFKLSIDADIVLGKKAFLSVKVEQISGLARLQFTRKPYTHWSLSFLGDPTVDLDIETQFQGRQMQSHVTSLISNQIKKAIRRKHTLPNYKLRYKPFFHKIDEDYDYSDILLNGTLDVNVTRLTRLKLLMPQIDKIYCLLTIGTKPWIVVRQYDDKNIVILIDIEIHKAKNQQIGISCKPSEHGTGVTITTIIPNTPATKANLCIGDVLVSIEGKKINHVNDIPKIIKSLNRTIFQLRIERLMPGTIKDGLTEDLEAYEDFNDFNISFTKCTDSVQIGTKLRRNSIDGKQQTQLSQMPQPSSESSKSSTPTNTPRRLSEKSLQKSKSRILSRGNSESKSIGNTAEENVKSKNSADNENIKKLDNSDQLAIPEFQQYSTIDYLINSISNINESVQFTLNDTSLYLNLNVYGKCKEESILLGYLNIPIYHILAECADSNLGNFIKQYALMPSDAPDLSTHPLSTQSGFDPNLCFGDVLLKFTWTENFTISSSTINDIGKKSKQNCKSSTDKLDEDKLDQNVTKQHDFIRTHFQRSTQCDFCGKKIWLKDAVQCRDCAMCCHKKCITKCQNSTICGPIDSSNSVQSTSSSNSVVPSFDVKVTEPPVDATDFDDFEEIDEPRPKLDQHRQSFSDLISQGLKRVNSANNLAIPVIVSAMNQNSRSLPPSPQHTPRKQSLINQSVNPFVTVAQKLEHFPDNIVNIERDQIVSLTEPLIGCGGTPDELMSLAKSTSRNLYADLDSATRLNKINDLLSKLKIALDYETNAHANLTNTSIESFSKLSAASQNNETTIIRTMSPPTETNFLLQTKGPGTQSGGGGGDGSKKVKENVHDAARRAFLIGQSEERVQALSIIMLYLCTGLQYAQGIANQ